MAPFALCVLVNPICSGPKKENTVGGIVDIIAVTLWPLACLMWHEWSFLSNGTTSA